eukprot:9498337-Pyramimonas_sp.AAC.1
MGERFGAGCVGKYMRSCSSLWHGWRNEGSDLGGRRIEGEQQQEHSHLMKGFPRIATKPAQLSVFLGTLACA